MFLDVTCIGVDIPDSLVYVFSLFYVGIRLGIPLLLIIVGMFDMGKAIVAKKEEDVKKAQKLLVRKLIVGVIVFLLPYFVELIVKIVVRDDDILNCLKALIDYRTNLIK